MEHINIETLMDQGIDAKEALQFETKIRAILSKHSGATAWKLIQTFLTPTIPFSLHLQLFSLCYPDREIAPEKAAAWFPPKKNLSETHLGQWMNELNCDSVKLFHAWSVQHRELFWQKLIEKMRIPLIKPPQSSPDLTDTENPNWFPGAKLNIVDSCFTAKPEQIALIHRDKTGALNKITYGALEKLVNQIAGSLVNMGCRPGDAIAIILPMHPLAVAIYLGIIRMGGIVVSIADSFSSDEIAARLTIANTKIVFAQHTIVRDQKTLPLYEKIISAHAPKIILLHTKTTLRAADIRWEDFFNLTATAKSYAASPETHCNILFSSGTTGMPKAIPWNHSTPLKAAGDAFLYHNLTEKDVVTWPTNLGWMMGPWLIFASFINHATIALYEDTPRDAAFGQFIEDAKVTILGVVPTLVASWRQSKCMEAFHWDSIRLFSSTGECSNADDMLYLMSRANYQPILEYCGGTEIGGAYITSSLLENNCPSVFNTKTFGLDFILLDEHNNPSDNGEVALIPPSIGLSTELLNANHHAIYFENMPSYQHHLLRRHGDHLQRLSNGHFTVLGRIDDTMNIGGIKVSSTEIERVILMLDNIIECAAVGITSKQAGPTRLVLFCVIKENVSDLKTLLQKQINSHLNPLFRIYDVVIKDALPRTTSGKIIRRVLRDEYLK